MAQVDDNDAELDGGLSVGIPFEGQEETAGIMPEVSFIFGDQEWIASSERAELDELPAGSSQVDSYQVDGNTVTGTATFYERSAPLVAS